MFCTCTDYLKKKKGFFKHGVLSKRSFEQAPVWVSLSLEKKALTHVIRFERMIVLNVGRKSGCATGGWVGPYGAWVSIWQVLTVEWPTATDRKDVCTRPKRGEFQCIGRQGAGKGGGDTPSRFEFLRDGGPP
jgi:hypothetical protein